MTSLRIEPATFLLVAQYLNQPRYRVSPILIKTQLKYDVFLSVIVGIAEEILLVNTV
jgi:hypothetical protein